MAHAQKPDFVFRRNGRVHLNRQGASVQSTTGSRGVRISGSNAGYTMFRGSVEGTGYPLHSPVPLHFPSRASPCAIAFQLDSIRFNFVSVLMPKRFMEGHFWKFCLMYGYLYGNAIWMGIWKKYGVCNSLIIGKKWGGGSLEVIKGRSADTSTQYKNWAKFMFWSGIAICSKKQKPLLWHCL